MMMLSVAMRIGFELLKSIASPRHNYILDKGFFRVKESLLEQNRGIIPTGWSSNCFRCSTSPIQGTRSERWNTGVIGLISRGPLVRISHRPPEEAALDAEFTWAKSTLVQGVDYGKSTAEKKK